MATVPHRPRLQFSILRSWGPPLPGHPLLSKPEERSNTAAARAADGTPNAAQGPLILKPPPSQYRRRAGFVEDLNVKSSSYT